MSDDDRTHHARLRALCEGALELDESERDAWLERLCGDDPALHDEIVDLLRRIDTGGILSEWLTMLEERGFGCSASDAPNGSGTNGASDG